MILELKNIEKSFGEKKVLTGVSLEAEGGKAFGLLGRNGAGKTTSIRILMDVFPANSGEVLIDGKPINYNEIGIGYLPEERGLYPKKIIIDQLTYFAMLKGMSRKAAVQSIDYWLERLGMTEYRNKRLDTLSKGNQQKIQLMAALLSDPELLILDEPLSGLDPINADLFKGIIREEIAAGKYLIMSSHQMATVEEFCTDLTILDRSKTVLQGHLNDIKRSYGRVHLQLKTESDPAPYIAECGAQIVTQKEFEYQLKVTGAQQANGLLARLTQAGVPVVLFNLREPSLHEIFVETVGGESDA